MLKSIHVFTFFALTLLSCRPKLSASLVENDETPPNALFTELCTGYPQLGQDERSIFTSIVGSAFDQTLSTVKEGHTCEKIWTKMLEVKKFELRADVADLSHLKILAPIPDSTLQIQISKYPKHFEILKELKLRKLTIESFDEDMEPLTVAEKDEMLAVIVAGPQLESLRLERLGLSDLTGLTSLQGLISLDLSGNKVESLMFLKDWQSLKELNCYRCAVTDLTPLKNLLTLWRLELSENLVTSVDPLMFVANLRDLQLNRNPPLPNIMALQFLPGLKYLGLEHAGIKNIEPLKQLPLEFVNLRSNPFDSIEALRNAPIKELFISRTMVADLSPVATMNSLKRLGIAFTPATSLPELPLNIPLTTLDMEGTALQSLCPALKLPTLVNVRTPDGGFMTPFQISDARSNCG